jgi:hypothetical protein
MTEPQNNCLERCALTTFAQRVRQDQVLVTVPVAGSSFLGLVSYDAERSLVLARDGSIRDATAEELRESGG